MNLEPGTPGWEAMEREHEHWLVVVSEWDDAIGRSMNEPEYNNLIDAIEVWGERLVQLRMLQSPTDHDAIVASKLDKYRARGGTRL